MGCDVLQGRPRGFSEAKPNPGVCGEKYLKTVDHGVNGEPRGLYEAHLGSVKNNIDFNKNFLMVDPGVSKPNPGVYRENI
jgi:hypothetical protein